MERERGWPEREGDWGEALSANHQQHHNWRLEQTETAGQKGDVGWERARQEETGGLKDDVGWGNECRGQTVGWKDDAGRVHECRGG
jgi:hypothetical protein